MIIVKVVLPVPIRQSFEYVMSETMRPILGGRVVVPFRSKDVIGIIISFDQQDDINHKKLKLVKEILDTESIYTSVLLDLLIWINKNYHCPIGIIFFSHLPKMLKNGFVIKDDIIYKWTITEQGKNTETDYLKKKTQYINALIILKKTSIFSFELQTYQLSKLVLKKLAVQKLCTVESFLRSDFQLYSFFKVKKKIFLNNKHLIFIKKILKKKCFSSHLLSKNSLYEKIKFYLGLIQDLLYKKMQILIIVPHVKNINIIVVFLKKFFDVIIDVFHLKLTHHQCLKTWIKIKNGNSSIVIGTKNSIFLPFLKLGIIIILEEHSSKYKNTEECRYNCRDIGILRAYRENIPVILDSDTPSLKTLYNVFYKKCLSIHFNDNNYIQTINNDIIDLKQEKIKCGLSLTLINKINNDYKNTQTLLIFNKKTLFFFILKCDMCGLIFKCHHCNVYFEFNKYDDTLFCRFCFIKIKKPFCCQNCGCFLLISTTITIEDNENIINNLFPEIPVFFFYNKKCIKKKFFNQLSYEFSFSIPCVIFITEEIVENYFFPHVHLIGLITVDHYFFSLQFRKIEYFAQFYFNLIKLTKHKKKSLKILLQTSFLNTTNLNILCNDTYHIFAHKTLQLRKTFFLPPWSCQIMIYSKHLNDEKNIVFLTLFRQILIRQSKCCNLSVWLLGPHPVFLINYSKKKCYQLLIQSGSYIELNRLLKECIEVINLFSISKKIRWFIDIEPN